MTTRERGVTYLGLLLALALVSAVLASTATVWSQAQRREREKQLLWAGEQFRKALASYSRYGNGTYPRRLEDLLEDTRSRVVRRHIRQIYEDPMTRSSDWGVVRNAQGGIVGVYSRLQAAPLKTGDFRPEQLGFEEARMYSDWKFAATKVVTPEDLARGGAPAQPQQASGSAPSAPAPTSAPAATTGAPAAAAAVPVTPASKPAAAAPAPQTAPPADQAAAAKPPAEQSKAAAGETPQQSSTAAAEPPAYRPLAIPRAAVIGSRDPQPAASSSSPLTPLQNVQSPFAPSGTTPVTAAPASTNASAASAAPAPKAAK